MSQSKRMSAIETVASTAIGYGVSVAITIVVLPWFDLHPTTTESAQISAIFTVASLARGYLVRRIFNSIKGNVK